MATERHDSGRKRADGESTRSRRMTPEAAKRLLAEHDKIRDVELRGRACFEVIEALCRSGYANEAFTLINPEFGEVRTSQIEALFGNSGWTLEEATQKMKILMDRGYRGDGMAALSAYCRTMGLQDFRTALHSSAFNDYVAYFKQHSGITIDAADNVASTYFSVKVQSAADEKDRAAYWQSTVDLHREGLISDSGLARVIRANTSLSVIGKWHAFSQGIKSESGDLSVTKVRDEIVHTMVNQDAERAMLEIARVESSQASAAIGTATQEWLLNDGSGRVSEWYRENKDHLLPSHRDAVAKKFLQVALAFGERDTAQQWTDELLDPHLKAECLARLADWDNKQTKMNPRANQ